MDGNTGAPRGKSSATVGDLLDEGTRLEKAGLFEKALGCYREVRLSDAADAIQIAESWLLEAHAHHGLGAWDDALKAAHRSEELSRRLGDEDMVAEALNAAAAVHHARGRFDAAEALYEAMLDLAENPRVRGLALQNIAIIHGHRGALDEAERRLEEAYRSFDEADYTRGRAHVLNNMVAVANRRANYQAAEEIARRATKVAREADDLDLLAIATLNLAESLAGLDRLEEAEESGSIALGQFDISGNRWRRIACLRLLGDVNVRLGCTDVARKFWLRGLELAREMGAGTEALELEERLSEGAA